MKAQGIPIDAITIQNEPLNENNTPSMLMLAPDQAKFIKDALGPAFQKAGIKTKIVLYDHNVDRPDYPLSILKDSAASKYVDGSGFHLYEGKIDAMTQVHDAFPRKNLYFTEQMVIDEPATNEDPRHQPPCRPDHHCRYT
jgi:glucosylceramidase